MDTMHIRRLNEVSSPLVEGFKGLINAVKSGKTPEALRVVFRKRDESIRTMDIAFDAGMLDSIKNTRAEATAKRSETNEARDNVVVRERLKDADTGAISFRWRTIPVRRIMSISPCA